MKSHNNVLTNTNIGTKSSFSVLWFKWSKKLTLQESLWIMGSISHHQMGAHFIVLQIFCQFRSTSRTKMCLFSRQVSVNNHLNLHMHISKCRDICVQLSSYLIRRSSFKHFYPSPSSLKPFPCNICTHIHAYTYPHTREKRIGSNNSAQNQHTTKTTTEKTNFL